MDRKGANKQRTNVNRTLVHERQDIYEDEAFEEYDYRSAVNSSVEYRRHEETFMPQPSGNLPEMLARPRSELKTSNQIP